MYPETKTTRPEIALPVPNITVGIERVGERIVIDGYAPDGTPEAIYVKDAPGFTLSVQWHPEWNADQDPVSRPLFQAFGQAAYDYAMARSA